MLKKWLPWKFIIKRAARAYGFLDPITLLARLRRFGHPSEVHEPIELIRAGVVFHARGLVNTRAIQYNLDWIWPFWIVKQFKPNDISFIPRGFAFSHVNLTHRNWTAVGHPDLPHYPIVDPRGLVTPYLDSWSIDCWLLPENGPMLVPSEVEKVHQRLNLEDDALSVFTRTQKAGLRLDTTVRVDETSDGCQTHIHASGFAENGGYLVLALRPYNPEGIQFIDSIAFDQEDCCFLINGQTGVHFNHEPEKVIFSNYEKGDVAHILDQAEQETAVKCDIGMATAAAIFPVAKKRTTEITVSMPLVDAAAASSSSSETVIGESPVQGWQSCLDNTARLKVPDEKIRFLYDAAVRTMLLLSAGNAYPGPYTYKRFWFRDACLMIHALLAIGLSKRASRMILDFPSRQTLTGYFQSQEGEWDSNGQVLWIAGRLHELTGITYDTAFIKSIFKGANWIINKRSQLDTDKPHHGLLPAGFSAEHLGPNDYYYWDNYWGLAGLRAAGRMAGDYNFHKDQDEFYRQAAAFHQHIMNSIDKVSEKKRQGGIPASPYRRMDAGAVGSIVADYPLQLTLPNDPMIMKTIAYLMENCFHSGAFFQDMIHSGINVYLTLAIAQSLLRAGDPTYRQLIQTVADLSTPTGQWPEAIHPFTRGGCMGDGQHGWASAEWLMMMRNLFVREEGNTIIIGSGIFPKWIESGKEISFGPTLIPGGELTVTMRGSGSAVFLDLDVDNRNAAINIVVAIPGYQTHKLFNTCHALEIKRLPLSLF
ncbi:MAG: hypothetical protein K9L30_07465 [Desulfobacterales bacterium]|nr:hypothetical protein [Desulfobacterales bacterium]